MADTLTEQQIRFYETFGFLRLRGLFADEISTITDAFEQVFAEPEHERWNIDNELHGNRPRLMIPGFIDKHPELARLKTDPRVLGVAEALLGPGFDYIESDGNLYWCDSEWHADVYKSPIHIRHVKLSFYLDPLDAGTGAARVIPGTNHWRSPFATKLREAFVRFGEIPSVYGVDGPDIPSVTLESEPGDLLLWDFRTLHASYASMDRRRLFTMNFRERTAVSA